MQQTELIALFGGEQLVCVRMCACPVLAQPRPAAGSEKRIGLTSLVWMEVGCRWRLQINKHNSHNCVGESEVGRGLGGGRSFYN